MSNLSALRQAPAVQTSRVPEVDCVRGVLILLMCSTHALTLSGIEPESWLFRGLPRGWATHGFVILSGFTLSYVLQALHTPRRLEWAARRGMQLCVLAVVSNLVFGLAGAFVQHRVSALATTTWWVSHTMGPRYSLSAVLFPTAFLLFLLPVLSWARGRLGSTPLLIVAVLLTLLVGALSAHTQPGIWRYLISPGLGGFPLLLMVAEGVTGCAAGAWALGRRWSWPVIAVVVLGALASLAAGGPLIGFRSIGRLTLIALAAIGWCRLGVFGILRRAIAMVGRFPLMAFLGHRVAMQVAAVILAAAVLSPVAMYVSLLSTAMVAVWACSELRVRSRRFDGVWRAIWL